MSSTERGYAFVFVLLALGLLGVALLGATEVDSTLSRREREQALLQVGHEFRTALARYHKGQNGLPPGQYPASLEDLVLDRRQANVLRHLRRVYPDPMTGRAEWGLVLRSGRIVGIHSTSASRPLKQDGFDPDDSAFKRAGSYREWVFSYPADLSRPLPPQNGASAPVAGFAPVPLPESPDPVPSLPNQR